ncbi:RhoGAP domain containing protein [Acanthamoeba castellanii str. Neff]|uniref:RhoGAP domain containing protein n=1 Tax=Acanthamoeba castellanii (strain ATCC 30010 / Neff) TaxID=1257118 RepID=L8HM35_ACACF|nr:RhoGAP domain containing protein [Acanthamoeba castellanii str. Neff]ELR25466.1 RhoGAP domain containing protein [Acanthamoeba castellanii str. Neff]
MMVELRATVVGRADPFLFALSADHKVRSAVRLLVEEEARHRLPPVVFHDGKEDSSSSYNNNNDGPTTKNKKSEKEKKEKKERKKRRERDGGDDGGDGEDDGGPRLVVLPRPFGSAEPRRESLLADPDAILGSLQLTPEDTVVLMHDVVLVKVYMCEASNGTATDSGGAEAAAVVPIDFGAKLKHSLALLRAIFFDPRAPEEDFALLYSAATIDVNAIDGINRWVTINESPRDQKLDPQGKMTVFPISHLLTLPANTKHFLPAEREGFLLFKEPLKSGRRGGQHGKRLCFHIKDYLLFVWPNQIDLSSKKPPKRVIPLDHYCIQSVSNEPPVYTFSLRRDPTLGIDDAETPHTLYHISSKEPETHQKWVEAVQSKCVNTEPTKLFGVELNTVMARKREVNNRIPVMLQKCIAYLDKYGLDKEGIFRISGDALEIEAYKQAFDSNEDVEFKAGTDVHVYDCFVVAHSQLRDFSPDKDTVTRKMVELLVGLSSHHNNVLHVLTQFLARVEKFSEKNLMHLSNLATIFGPNLLRRPNGANERDVFKTLRLSLPSNAILAPIVLPSLPIHMTVSSPRHTHARHHSMTAVFFSPRSASDAPPAATPAATKERSATISGTPRARMATASLSSSSGYSVARREDKERERQRKKEKKEQREKKEKKDEEKKRQKELHKELRSSKKREIKRD